MTEQKRRFTVISNEELEKNNKIEEDNYKKERMRGYQTNPLKERFLRFANEEVGRKFSVDDLLKW
jgi:hypothetical protein